MENGQLNILLVEDNEDDYIAIQTLFSKIKRWKLSLDWVRVYQSALEVIRYGRHNVYLVDYRLGEWNGLHLLRHAIANGCKAPIILLTEETDQEIGLEAVKAGAADCLIKGQIDALLLERSIHYAIERVQILEALRESEERYRQLVELSPEAIVVHSAGTINFVNAAGAKLFGTTSPKQITEKSIQKLIRPDYWEIAGERIQRRQEEGKQASLIEESFVRFDGRIVDVEMSTYPITYQGKPAQQSIIRNITERKRLERQIRESLERRARQVQTSTEVAQEIAAAPALDILFKRVVNLVQKGFGYYHAHIYTLEENNLVMQEGTGGAGRMMKEVGHKIPLTAQKSLVARAAQRGKPVLVSDVSQESGWLPNILLAETKSELAVPIKLRNEVLGVLDIQSDTVAGLTGEDQVLLMGLCGQIAIAINNQRLEEMRNQAEETLIAYATELERSNRELQDFAYVASHDLQEPLRKINSFGDRLHTRYSSLFDDRGRDYLNRMQNAAARMQALIQDLLIYSQVTTTAQPFVSVDLVTVVQDVLSDLETTIEEFNGQVEVDTLPTIEADRTQMGQLFQNLIGNALKFHQKDTTPIVKVQGQCLPDQDCGNELCRITVADNGIGFSEKYLDRIFGVFQRLHSRSDYEGTGVGLAICRKIVERHGGTITATSAPEQGTTFIITLPVKQAITANLRRTGVR